MAHVPQFVPVALASASAVPILGAVVMWSELRGCSRAALDGALAGAALDAAPLPGRPGDGDAMRRAVELLGVGAGGRSMLSATWKALPSGRDATRYAVAWHATAGAALVVARSYEVTAHHGAALGAPAVAVVGTSAASDEGERAGLESRMIAALARARAEYLARDVRGWLVRQLSALARGFALRDGVYFVAAAALPELERIDAVLRLAGAGGLVRFDVIDDAAAREAARVAAEGDLASELADVLAAVGSLRGSQRLRRGSVLSRAGEVAELRERAEFLARALGATVAELASGLVECDAALAALAVEAST